CGACLLVLASRVEVRPRRNDTFVIGQFRWCLVPTAKCSLHAVHPGAHFPSSVSR
ncbi:TPA: hypothetical protein N0F65_002932, partial [Lagenidium giganteum]